VESRRRLILLRHAKSSWDDASLPDEKRPLAPRGKRAVAALEQYLQANDPEIELVLCSPARRTRETWDGVRNGLRSAPDVRFVPEVYEATADDLLDVLHQVDDRYTSILVIGHNPGMEDLADGLIADGKRKALARLGHGFPTGALATLSLDVTWTELDRGAARLERYARPKDLSGA
jgi:phosphohistidine phosphatase